MRARALLALSCCLAPISAGRDWRARIDWNAMERDLEAGDDPELLVAEDTLLIREMERRRAAALQPPDGGSGGNEADWMRHTAAHGGPTMLFAELQPTQPWSSAQLAALADEWTELLHTAGITASVYEVAEARLLVTLQTGWRGYDVRAFLLAQPAVASVSWDGEVAGAGEDSVKAAAAASSAARGELQQHSEQGGGGGGGSGSSSARRKKKSKRKERAG